MYGGSLPAHHYCFTNNVNLSKSYESEIHSFSGSLSQKSQATVVEFQRPIQIDFIPREILTEFPNLTGLLFYGCNFPVLKAGFFTEEFGVLESLSLILSEIVSIEPWAFEHLKKLNWLDLTQNQIQALPFNLFQKNPSLAYLNFAGNQINSISPNLFNNLNHLKTVDFRGNLCVDKKLGCDACTVAQLDLDFALSTCFQNCLKDPDCAGKSEQNTSPRNSTNSLQNPGKDDLVGNPIQNTTPTLQSPQTQEPTNIPEKLESTEEKLAKCAEEKRALGERIEKLEREIVGLKKETQDRESALGRGIEDVSKRLEELGN
jgi:hypothetical protein